MSGLFTRQLYFTLCSMPDGISNSFGQRKNYVFNFSKLQQIYLSVQLMQSYFSQHMLVLDPPKALFQLMSLPTKPSSCPYNKCANKRNKPKWSKNQKRPEKTTIFVTSSVSSINIVCFRLIVFWGSEWATASQGAAKTTRMLYTYFSHIANRSHREEKRNVFLVLLACFLCERFLCQDINSECVST